MRNSDSTARRQERISARRVWRSAFFDSARKRAAEILGQPRKLNRLLDRAAQAVEHQGHLSELREALNASLRLLRAWAAGRYRRIPVASLLSIVAALVYLVTPVDLVPDFILTIGLLDDAALLGWVLSSLRGDIDRFKAWERSRSLDAPGSEAGPPTGSALGA